MSIVGAIICFGISAAATLFALIGYSQLGSPFVTCEQIAVTQRWTMIAGFFAWFGFNILS